jgi:hypothetical protein
MIRNKEAFSKLSELQLPTQSSAPAISLSTPEAPEGRPSEPTKEEASTSTVPETKPEEMIAAVPGAGVFPHEREQESNAAPSAAAAATATISTPQTEPPKQPAFVPTDEWVSWGRFFSVSKR